MKKIFSKITNNRRKEFQIETSIWKINHELVIRKAPLGMESVRHIKKMHEYFCNYKDGEIYSLAPCHMKDEVIEFPYIQGKSLCSYMLECISRNDVLDFHGYLLRYKAIVADMKKGRETTFDNSPEFIRIFGDAGELIGVRSASGLNIDLTFDNIILQGDKNIILDYEWIFDIQIPVNFVVYRAIHGFCVKYGRLLNGLLTEDELLKMNGIESEQKETFVNMENKFIDYVYDEKNGYDALKKNYRKKCYDIGKVLEIEVTNKEVATLFWDRGNGFSEEETIKIPYVRTEEELVLRYQLPQELDLKRIRLDVCEKKCMLKIVRLQAMTAKQERITIEAYTANAEYQSEQYLVFLHDDPQIIVENPYLKDWIWIEACFEITIPTKSMFQIMDAMVRDRNYFLKNKQDLETRLKETVNDYMVLKNQ